MKKKTFESATRTGGITCCVVLLGCCHSLASFAANPPPRPAAPIRQVQPLKSVAPKTVVNRATPTALAAAPKKPARETSHTDAGNDETGQPTNIEESILLSKAPENIDSVNSQLATVSGSMRIDITLPETIGKFSNAETIDTISLGKALLGAYGFSRDIKMAESRKDQAISQSNQARGLLLPTLTIRNSRGRETSSPGSVVDANTGNAKITDTHLRKDDTITLRQPLIDGPSLIDWQRRDVIVDSRQGSVVSTQGDTYVSTTQAYLNVATTRILADLYREYEQQLGFLLDYVAKRADAGASSNADMERVRARALAAQSTRIEQESAHAAAVVEFVRITNLAPRYLQLPLRQEAARDLPLNFTQGIELALDTNPDIRILKAELEAVDKEISAAKARALPRVDFELSDSKIVNAGGPSGLQHDQRAMVVMTWSVLSGTVDYYNYQEKREKRTEAFWKLEDQERRLRQTLSAQYATLEATRSRITAGYQEWTSTYQAARSMSQRMLSGNQSLLDLLDTLDRVQQARARLVNLHAVEISSTAQISRLIGKIPDVDQLAAQDMSRFSDRRNSR